MSEKRIPDEVKLAFAHRLERLMVERGWNQSELARRASLFMPHGKKMGRDNISNYCRGDVLPGPVHLNAIAKALGVRNEELLPARNVDFGVTVERQAGRAEMKETSNGNVHIFIDKEVPMSVALRVWHALSTKE
jgi:transcriptional regulator with XRE-family HTH domain